MIGNKLTFVFSLILVLALGLSACTPATTPEPGTGEPEAVTASPVAGVTAETGGEVTEAPTTVVGATEEPGAATATPGAEATEEPGAGTATPEAEATEEPGAGTATPGAEATEEPGAALEGAWSFSDLLYSTVWSSGCEPVGQFQGLVLDQQTGQIHYIEMYAEVNAVGLPTGRYLIPWEATVASTQGTGVEGATEGTPEAGTPEAGAATGTPEAGTPEAGAATGTPEAGGATGTPEAGTPAAGTPEAGAATGTPETGTGVGEVVCDAQEGRVVLTVGPDQLASAPSFTITPNTAAEGWDDEIAAFWTGELGALPVTGEVEGAQLTLVETVNDLSVAGAADEQIAEVEDLIIDQQTGRVTHVVVSTGGSGGEELQLVPIPWEALSWASGRPLTLGGGADESVLAAAPGFTSLDELLSQTATTGWDTEIQDYWSQYFQQ